MLLQTKLEEEGSENPFVLAVTVKDEHGNIDLGAIAESEYLVPDQYLSLIACYITVKRWPLAVM